MAIANSDRDRLRLLAEEAGRTLEGATPQSILRWGAKHFGRSLCIAASMADAVMIHLASSVLEGVDIIFLDTGYHFEETLETRDRVAARYPITLHSIQPRQTVAEQDALFGPQLYERDPDACCNLRKVEPLRRALEPFAAWASGMRRDETAARKHIGVVEWDANRQMVKLNPLAAWSDAEGDDYIAEHDIVLNPLLSRGYPSIGCEPCTFKVAPGENPRSGRWAGSTKTECGLHFNGDGTISPARSATPAGDGRANAATPPAKA